MDLLPKKWKSRPNIVNLIPLMFSKVSTYLCNLFSPISHYFPCLTGGRIISKVLNSPLARHETSRPGCRGKSLRKRMKSFGFGEKRREICIFQHCIGHSGELSGGRDAETAGYCQDKGRDRPAGFISCAVTFTFGRVGMHLSQSRFRTVPFMAGDNRIILHVDMDSFYASIEVRERPALLGFPVVVGADPRGGAGRGVVSTCSYEARRCGIHSGQPISRAFDLCPHAVFLPVNHRLYAGVSGNVMQILMQYAERMEQVSIDEAYLDLTGIASYTEAEQIARSLKDAVLAAEGLTCSVGIGPSKVIAKIASDFQKPDGLTVVPPGRVSEFLAPLPVGKIPGVGKKTGVELAGMGIHTVGELAAYDVQELITRFGSGGVRIRDLALGRDEREVEMREGAKSISREMTFEEDTDDTFSVGEAMDLLAADLAQTLAKEALRFRTLTVKVRYRGFVTHTRSRTFDHATSDPAVIREGARELLAPFLDGRYIRLIGLRLSGFDRNRVRQASLDEFFTPEQG